MNGGSSANQSSDEQWQERQKRLTKGREGKYSIGAYQNKWEDDRGN